MYHRTEKPADYMAVFPMADGRYVAMTLYTSADFDDREGAYAWLSEQAAAEQTEITPGAQRHRMEQ